MKIEITKSVDVKETIDIEWPYYCVSDHCGDYDTHMIYRKIMKSFVYTIIEKIGFHYYVANPEERINYEIEREERDRGHDCYFASEYKSTKEEYDAAKSRAAAFLEGL